MSKIYNVKYVDARYNQEDLFDDLKLPKCEAYGYKIKKGKDVVLAFIQKVSKNHTDGDKDKYIEGLVLPKESVVTSKTTVLKFKYKDLNRMVGITWKDMVHFLHSFQHSPSIMYTEGKIIKITKDSVVISDPETVRLYPAPLKNHPQIKPAYYQIPIALITNVDFFT